MEIGKINLSCKIRNLKVFDFLLISLYNKSVTIAINKVFITARICWSSIAAFAGSNILASSFRITGQGTISSKGFSTPTKKSQNLPIISKNG
ncbi:unnamed protein product [Rhizophagus irregularis]|nr:unnamed protein product [Rhizophagus irregularis]